MKNVIGATKNLINHPTIYSRGGVCWRFFTWQLIEKHFAKNGHVKNWIDGRKLLVIPGRTTSTGNYYWGLMEYSEMSFLLDYLRDEDVFVDVGANIGAYSVLLGKICKRGYAFEPSVDTYKICCENLKLNNFKNVKLNCLGVGNSNEKVLFTKGLDATNHVINDKQSIESDDVEKIQIVSLDEFLKHEKEISIIKIDVEGLEEQVLDGAKNLLNQSNLNIVIMEVFENEKLVDLMKQYGFKAYMYDADKHVLHTLKYMHDKLGDNCIFIKDIGIVEKRGIKYMC